MIKIQDNHWNTIAVVPDRDLTGRHRATDPDDDRDDTEITTETDTSGWGRLSPAVAEATKFLAHDWPDAAANRHAGGEG